MINRIFSLAFAVALSALAVFVPPAWCQEYKVKLVASSLDNPELGNFNTSLSTPVIEGDYVVFRTLDPARGNQVGFIWSWNMKTGQFTRLVDLATPAPGGTGNFTDLNAGFGGPVLKDGMVIFGARDSRAPGPPVHGTGIFSVPVSGGAIQRIANYNTAVPGGIGNFFSFGSDSRHTGNISFHDGVVGFEAEFGGGPIGNSGIYQSDIAGGNMRPIGDTLHPINPQDLFPVKSFFHVSIHSNRAAFIGGTVFGYAGLYSTQLPASLGNYNPVIAVGTVLPGASTGFEFILPSVRLFGDSIYFIASDTTIGGANKNRRTLYRVPFAGGAPNKIVSNFDPLEGLPSIELDSLYSYDLNQNHLLLRAKAPGSTRQQGLYLFDRVSGGNRRIFTLEEDILGRAFNGLAELQPGAITEDSSKIVISIGGSAFFIGPFNYIVVLSKEDLTPPPGGPVENDTPVNKVRSLLAGAAAVLKDAKKTLPPKPDSSMTKKQKAKVKAKRAAIQSARKTVSNVLRELTTMAKEEAVGAQVAQELPNFTAKNVSTLKKNMKDGTSAQNSAETVKKAWKSFGKLLGKLQQAG